MISSFIDLDGITQSYVAREIIAEKYSRIGAGCSADVYDIQDNKILKITDETELYPFYEFLMNNPHPNLPVVYDIKKCDNFMVIISKKYEHIPLKIDSNRAEILYKIRTSFIWRIIDEMHSKDLKSLKDIKNDTQKVVSKDYDKRVVSILKNFIEDYFDDIYNTIQILKNIKDIDWCWDLHYFNFMMDGNTIILNDPFRL